MSARLLRKVLQEQEELKRQENEVVEEVDSDSPVTNPPRNPFDLLNEEEDEIEVDVEAEDAYEEKFEKASVKKAGASALSKSKSKKKKKKSKENSNKAVDEDFECLNIGLESSSQNSCKFQDQQMSQGTSSVLVVDPKCLKPENELRRIFGSDVVRSFEKDKKGGSSRQMRGGRRGGHNTRKTYLVSPLEHWPRWDGSMSMERLETKDGKHYFKYVHSSSYSQAQKTFQVAKEMHDLNGIASILQYYPYHVESLITLAEVLKFSGELDQSADAIAKCLFALECSWHPQFSPLQANCQLKYIHDTNKPIFSVLFTHMLNMNRRGCHRSALEVCKLLLSLDSDDPKGAMFCIDYFSLRAEEYSWLERFSEEYISDNSLWLYPNFSYSLAICRFYLESESCSKISATDSEKATPNDLMKQALMLHPLVLKKLVAKAPLKDAAWTKILQHPFFGSAQAGGPSLEHLINIYVERSYIMWRLPELQKLLRDAADNVITSLDRSESDARDWACVRKETFSSDKNEYSHLLVSDFSDSVPQLPPEELRNLMQDPHMAHGMPNVAHIPPEELQNFLEDPHMAQAVIQHMDPAVILEAVAHVPRDVHNRHPVVVLLESILPWMDYGAAHGDNQDHGHDQGNEH
ncbi:hypothetical protein MKX01_018023 [Papaver californicum]|nr:hypothetical protein MKX01_018023 [Papaver californicum]